MPRTPRQTKHSPHDGGGSVGGGGSKVTPQKARRVYSEQEIIDALYECNGLIARVAKMLDCSRKSIYERAEKSPTLKAAIEDSRRYAVDATEDALHKRIEAGDTTAIIFLLKTLGKERGYVERVEMTGKDGGNLISFAELAQMVKAAKEASE